MSEIAWLKPDNIDDAMLNWAAWANDDKRDVNDPINAVSLDHAMAVDRLYDMLHHKEKAAIKAKYLSKGVKCPEAWEVTAEQAIEQGLRDRKLI